MNKSRLRDTGGILLTVPQIARLLNLGIAKTRELAEESGAIRRFGRCVRVDRQVLLDYITAVYGEC